MKTKFIYWDSCVFISYLGGDGNKHPQRQSRMDAVARVVGKDGFRLLTSVITYTEIIQTEVKPDSIDTFDKFTKSRKNIKIVMVNSEIAKKAQDIRNSITPIIKTPDAIHLATAILGGAEIFHTFDQKLVNRSGQDAVDNLVITTCELVDANSVMKSLFDE